MIINNLPIISFILTIALNIALISFITVIILNKKLIGAKSNQENSNEKDESSIATEFECMHESDSHSDKRTKIDTDFLDRVISIIFREITNTDNIIEVISSELCISSSQLNRRIKLMTGMTTTKFILKTRLNRAKKQLSVTQKPIGEVAMDCGFNDFAYFSRSFKKEFDMTPTTFQRMTHSVIKFGYEGY